MIAAVFFVAAAANAQEAELKNPTAKTTATPTAKKQLKAAKGRKLSPEEREFLRSRIQYAKAKQELEKNRAPEPDAAKKVKTRKESAKK